MSDDCKVNCIDKGKNFCPTSDHKMGYCCDSTDKTCTRSDVCSSDNTKSFTYLKYWACLYNKPCGSNYKLTPTFNGAVMELKPANDVEVYAGDDICKYLIQFPTGASTNDVITV